MSKPWIHAESSAKKFGGKPEDYLPIHEFLDSSKGAIADNRHRALTHHAWFLSFVLPRVFGETAINSAGQVYSVRDVGEQHVLEDNNGFIPTAQDYLAEIEYRDWMQNGNGKPPSCAKLTTHGKATYAAARERIQQAREAAATLAKTVFDEGAAALFAAHPVMDSFSWTQYTPYFNDGDACNFNVHTDEPDINGEDLEFTERGYDWVNGGRVHIGEPSDRYKAQQAVSEFLKSIAEEDMLMMFGDHVKVTANRNAETEVDEYSHE